MPEGDTIWRLAGRLRELLAGREVTAARPPSLERLTGRTLEAVEPVGKHLLMRFTGGWSLQSHMRMSGWWHVHGAGEFRRRRGPREPVVLEFGDLEAVCSGGPAVKLVRNTAESVGHLGPDVLADDFPLEVVVARARAAGPKAVGELLLDQTVCAGIGNVYRCETLWQLSYDPWRSAAELADAQLAEMFATARRDMRANLGTAPLRLFDGTAAAVHGRRGRPCPRCGTPIRARRQGEHARVTYWCPRCQTR